MGEAELEKQRNMVTKSSINRKPLSNLTNIVRKPYPISPFSQSKRSSTASDSSIGSTQNPIHEHHPLISPPNQPLPSSSPTLTPAHLIGDERRSNMKEVAVPLCSSTSRKRNQLSLHKTTNDMNDHHSSMEKIKNKRNATAASIPPHQMKNTKNTMDTPIPHSTLKIKDKGKGIAVQSSYQKENTNTNLPHSLMKRKDKGKSIAVPLLYCPPTKTKIVEALKPSSGVILKDKGKSIMNFSNVVDHLQKEVVTPVYQRTLKKDKGSSCPPLLRTKINRNQDDGSEDTFQSKLQTEPPPNKKKRCSSKESGEEYVLPKDFVEQQRAYFKEIDDFELEVEEV